MFEINMLMGEGRFRDPLFFKASFPAHDLRIPPSVTGGNSSHMPFSLTYG